MAIGVVHELTGDLDRARKAYETALSINPRFAPAANNLAWIQSEHGGNRENALALAQTAKDAAPDDPRISDTLGWILYRRGSYQRALPLLQESAAKLPDNPQVQYHLGMTYVQVGDHTNARKALTAAVGSPVDFQGKDDARKALAGLQ
jgi:Flp pilus assembly protein TadD